MMNVVGRPGTRASLALRVAQLLFAGASLIAVVTSSHFNGYSAFFYLYCSMSMQLLKSFVLACIDIAYLVTNLTLNFPSDCIGILSFSAATASAGVVIFFKRDTLFCRAFPESICDQYEISVILAFMAWSFGAASALSLFWFRVSFVE